jgi:hypothetical protein
MVQHVYMAAKRLLEPHWLLPLRKKLKYETRIGDTCQDDHLRYGKTRFTRITKEWN